MNTRRRFLFGCTAAAAAVSLVPVGSMGLPRVSASGIQSLDQLTYADFSRQLRTSFQVRLAPSRAVELQLLKARTAPSSARITRRPPGDAGHERFSLVFGGESRELLAPAIHEFEHGRLGRFEMFIAQIGPDDHGQVRYEAVFNRPAKKCPAQT